MKFGRGALFKFVAFIAAISTTAIARADTTTIRVVTYNIKADTPGFETPGYIAPRPGLIQPADSFGNYTGTVNQGGVLEGIGEEPLGPNNNVQPLDILALMETTSNAITVAPILNGLNSYYNSPGMYAQSTLQGTQSGPNTSGNGPNAIVYNTKTLQLIDSVGVGTPMGTANGEFRQIMRYTFAPASVMATTSNEFYVYVVHMKSSTGSTNIYQNEFYRQEEATIMRNDAASLPLGANILYLGGFNISNTNGFTNPNPPGDTASIYQTMVASSPSPGQAVDPLNPTNQNVTWNNDPSYAATFTDNATDLHVRDDFQFQSSNIYNGTGSALNYVPNTLHPFGNNGSTGLGNSVTDPSNTALSNVVADGGTFISQADLLNDLAWASQHLPLVADYTIPVPEPSSLLLVIVGLVCLTRATKAKRECPRSGK